MVPKQTAPLAKSVRTLENILAVATSALIAAGSAIDPHQLPPKVAGILATVLSFAVLTHRTVLKISALKSIGAVVSSADPLGEIIKEVEAAAGNAPVDAAAAEVQAKPGTPAAQVNAGLAPTVPDVAAVPPAAPAQ